MYSWSRHYAESSILQHVDDTRCRYDETTRNCLKQKECGNLLLVMEYYHEKVNPSCPSSCSCFLTQVQEVMKERKERSYTVQVNCTSQNLTYFPKLPIHTRIVDLSDNKVRVDIIEGKTLANKVLVQSQTTLCPVMNLTKGLHCARGITSLLAIKVYVLPITIFSSSTLRHFPT